MTKKLKKKKDSTNHLVQLLLKKSEESMLTGSNIESLRCAHAVIATEFLKNKKITKMSKKAATILCQLDKIEQDKLDKTGLFPPFFSIVYGWA